jgi:hypothetical protein
VRTPDGTRALGGVRVKLFVNADVSHLPARPTEVTRTDADGNFGFWGTTTGGFTDLTYLPSASTPLVRSVGAVMLQPAASGRGPATLAIGAPAASVNETVGVLGGTYGRHVLVVVRQNGRRTFAQVLKTSQLSQIVIDQVASHPNVRVRGNLPIPVYLQGSQGIRVLHRGGTIRA